MILTIQLSPEGLDALRKALRVSDKEYDKLQVRPEATSQHTKDIMYARKFLDLPIHSSPEVIYDHKDAPDRANY